MASGVEALIGSVTPKQTSGAGRRPRRTSPSDLRAKLLRPIGSLLGRYALHRRSRALPNCHVLCHRPPVTPLPVTDWKSTRRATDDLALAAATIAAASGCSLAFSRAAAMLVVTVAHRSHRQAGLIQAVASLRSAYRSCRPPVCPPSQVFPAPRRSGSARRRAPRPVPTIIDIGVARPSAHGHAMISTATALTSAWARRGSGPTRAQTTKLDDATTMTPARTSPET